MVSHKTPTEKRSRAAAHLWKKRESYHVAQLVSLAGALMKKGGKLIKVNLNFQVSVSW